MIAASKSRGARMRFRSPCAGVVALFACVASSAVGQSNAPTISGRVLAADSETPLRRARIAVAAGSRRAAVVLSDNDGRFVVEIPGAGTVPFMVTVTKGGYVTASTKIDRPDLRAPVVVRLPRGAAISGVAVDPTGAPVAGMPVTAARAGGAEAGTPAQYSSTTNDLGEYRIAGLAKGRYDVWAGATITALVPNPSGTGTKSMQVGAGEKTNVGVEAAEEVAGLQLVAPYTSPQDALAQIMRERGDTRISGTVADTVAVVGNTVTMVGNMTVVVSAGGQAAVQAPAPGTGGIKGRVLSAARRPVAGAIVRIAGTGTERSLRTDSSGVFSTVGLGAGQYTLQANAPGHMGWQFGQRDAGQAGRPIVVAPDQIVENLDIVLPPGRAISGFVVDEHGEPLEGARVVALELRYVGGRLTPVQAGDARTTDDKGRYRLWGLHQGSYVVTASVEGLVPAGSRLAAYPRTYFPGTPILGSAFPIDLREDATANLVFTPAGLADVRIIGRDGNAPLAGGTARLIESRRMGVVSDPRVTDLEADGTFVFRNVPAGEYVVQVRGDGPGRTGLYGTTEMSVGFEPMTVTIPTSYGTTIEGRLKIEGQRDQRRAAFRIGTVALDDRARDPATVLVITGDDYFSTGGLFGLTTVALLSAPGDDWYLKSWMVNGTDVADGGYDFGARPGAIEGSEIVLSPNGAVVTGRADEGTKPVDDYAIVIFPVSREMRMPQSRRMKFARSTLDGTFRIGGLPAGDYFVAAVSRMIATHDSGEWQNPDVLIQLESRAQRVSLLEAQTTNLSLRLIER